MIENVSDTAIVDPFRADVVKCRVQPFRNICVPKIVFGQVLIGHPSPVSIGNTAEAKIGGHSG